MKSPFIRLEMEQLEPRLRDALAPRVARLGYLGEFFKCAAVQPDSLLIFMQLTEALKEALPNRVTELVALTVTTATGNEYERNQHERLSERLGFDRSWIAAVTWRGSGLSPLSPAELAIRRLTLSALNTNGRGLSHELTEVVEAVGSAQAMAILMLIGRYWMHSLIVNAIGMDPPVPSIFAEDGS